MNHQHFEDHPFTWDHYRHILKVGLEAGYRYKRFRDDLGEKDFPIGTNNKRIYLRHDLDFDVDTAYHMATLEQSLGIHASYYLLLRSANYNPAQRRYVTLIQEITDMGHDVGLHFSLIDHPACHRDHDLAALIRTDTAILSSILGFDIKTFSFHNPTDGGQFSICVDGLINAYADRYFRDTYYTSDSYVRWNSGCPCQTLRHDNHEILQILTHPTFYADNIATAPDALFYLLRQKCRELLTYNVGQNRVLLEIDPTFIDALNWIEKMECVSAD